MIKKMLNIQRLLFSAGYYNANKSGDSKKITQNRVYQIISSLTIAIVFMFMSKGEIPIFGVIYPIIMILFLFENMKQSLAIIPVLKRDIVINLNISYLIVSVFISLINILLYPIIIIIFSVLQYVFSFFTIHIDVERMQYEISAILNSIDLTILTLLGFYCVFLIYLVFSFIKKFLLKVAFPIVFCVSTVIVNDYLCKIIPFVPKYEFEDPSVLDRLLRVYNEGMVLTIGLFCTVFIVSICCFILMKKRNLFAC